MGLSLPVSQPSFRFKVDTDSSSLWEWCIIKSPCKDLWDWKGKEKWEEAFSTSWKESFDTCGPIFVILYKKDPRGHIRRFGSGSHQESSFRYSGYNILRSALFITWCILVPFLWAVLRPFKQTVKGLFGIGYFTI